MAEQNSESDGEVEVNQPPAPPAVKADEEPAKMKTAESDSKKGVKKRVEKEYVGKSRSGRPLTQKQMDAISKAKERLGTINSKRKDVVEKQGGTKRQLAKAKTRATIQKILDDLKTLIP